MKERKIINIVGKVHSPVLSVQHRTKADNSDFYVCTVNCLTVDSYITEQGNTQPLNFWARVFYNPIAELTSTSAKYLKEFLASVKRGEIKQNDILYLSGVAEKGGLFVKNPISKLHRLQDVYSNNEEEFKIFGKIASYSFDNNVVSLNEPFNSVFENADRNYYTFNAEIPVIDFLNSLPKNEYGVGSFIGRNIFVFNVKKQNNRLSVFKIQNTDRPFYIKKILQESAIENKMIDSVCEKHIDFTKQSPMAEEKGTDYFPNY